MMSKRSSVSAAAIGAGLIINMFAGGGGTAEGIRQGVGRGPTINVNHDPPAIAMHAANHPEAEHYCQDVWGVDPKAATAGKDVDFLWLSPDCRHFSKAKGGQPVKKEIRGLANVAVKWAHAVNIRQGIILENVEEFQTWGPLIATDKGMMPCPLRKGEYFRRWVAAIRRAGATDVQWRNLRACDYGAPTIRKRLFLIARFDGEAIVWPKPTHAHADSEAVRSGRLLPFRTAADCIDWSIACPSIFERTNPLAEATNKRIAAGIVRYVLNAARPFIVPVTHTKGGNIGRPVSEPLATVTTAKGGELALVKPTLVKMDEAHAPFMVPLTHQGSATRTVDPAQPMPTITGANGGEYALIAPKLEKADKVAASLVQMGYGEHEGQQPRILDLEKPLGTVTAGGNKFAVVTADLTRADKVAAFMAQNNAGFYAGEGRPLTEPMSTATASGSQQSLVTANLVKLRGTCADGQAVDEPMPTLTAGGSHVGLVHAFLVKYYGAAADGQRCDEPLHTVTHQARFGLVTVMIDGETYVLTDIGFRMLTPRELARAQGFPDDYILDPVCEYRTPSGKLKTGPLPKAQQIAKIGNSVCPVMAKVLTAANFAPNRPPAPVNDYGPPGEQLSLFQEAA